MDLSMNPRMHFLESEEARFRDPSSLHSSLWFELENDPGTVLLGYSLFREYILCIRFGGERKRAPPHHIDRSRLLNMAPGMAFAIGLILVVGQLKEGPGTLAKTFTFPEYPYKETTKNVSRPNQFGESPRDGRVSILCTGYGRCLVFWGVALFAAPAS